MARAKLTLTARQHRRLILFAEANERGLGGTLRLAVDYLTEEDAECWIPDEVEREDRAASDARLAALKRQRKPE